MIQPRCSCCRKKKVFLIPIIFFFNTIVINIKDLVEPSSPFFQVKINVEKSCKILIGEFLEMLKYYTFLGIFQEEDDEQMNKNTFAECILFEWSFKKKTTIVICYC